MQSNRRRLLPQMASAILAILIAGAAFVPLAVAQTSRGTVTGTVTDPKSAVIAGAKVTLTNTETNVSRETTTNGEGSYRFDAVDLGTYKLMVSASGFGNLTNTDVRVS